LTFHFMEPVILLATKAVFRGRPLASNGVFSCAF
jgi:hypothetical protein